MADQEAAEQGEDQGEESAEAEEEQAEEEAEESAEAERGERAERFFALADALRAALSDRPSLELPELLRIEERLAIQMLFEAKTAISVDIGAGHISAVKRGKLVNQALATLQPLIAIGRSQDVPQARGAYAEIQEGITELRSAITTQGGVEAVIFPPVASSTTSGDGEDEEEEEDAEKGGGN